MARLNLSTRIMRSGEIRVDLSGLRSIKIGLNRGSWGARFRWDELLLATLAAELLERLDNRLRRIDSLVHELTCIAELDSVGDGGNVSHVIRLRVQAETPLRDTHIESIAKEEFALCPLLQSLTRGGSYCASLSVRCFTAMDRVSLF